MVLYEDYSSRPQIQFLFLLFAASPGGHCCRNMCPHDRYVYLSSLCAEPQTDNDKAKMVEILIKNGAEANAVDSRGKTPLHLASTVRSVEVTRVLLQNGADPNLPDEKVSKIILMLVLLLNRRQFWLSDQNALITSPHFIISVDHSTLFTALNAESKNRTYFPKFQKSEGIQQKSFKNYNA